MPRFSKFYSATEEEAAVNVRQLVLQQLESASPFSGDDAEQLTNYLKGSAASTLRSRNDLNQPLFRPQSTTQSIGKLLNEPRFSINEQRVFRDNRVVYASSSEGSVDWKARSRTPSSDEPSPPEERPPSSPTSRGTEASTIDDGLEHGRGYVSALPGDEIMGFILTSSGAEPARVKHRSNVVQTPEFRPYYTQDILQNMNTQFSKWSYDLKEGVTAIPFVMAQAPATTHKELVETDKGIWVTGFDVIEDDILDSQSKGKTPLERKQDGRPCDKTIILTLIYPVMGEERALWRGDVESTNGPDGVPSWEIAMRNMRQASKLGPQVDINEVYIREARCPGAPICTNDDFLDALRYLTSQRCTNATLVLDKPLSTAEKYAIVLQPDSLDKTSAPLESDSGSKRAALIAKSKATKDSSLVVSKSVGQRRSALQKNKNRKSIMPSPPPTPKFQESTPKSDPQSEKSKSTVMIFGNKIGEERRAVDSALNNKSINFDSNQEMEAWMAHLRKTDSTTSAGQVLGEDEVIRIRPQERERC